MQNHVNLVDLVKSFPTNIVKNFLQNLASLQQRTSPLKFDHLAEKSEKGSISNLSTKVRRQGRDGGARLSPDSPGRRGRVHGVARRRPVLGREGRLGVSEADVLSHQRHLER